MTDQLNEVVQVQAFKTMKMLVIISPIEEKTFVR